MADFYVGQGDLLPALTGVLLNIDQSAVDLTGATVSVQLVEMATGNVTLLPAAIIDNPTLGQVAHVWISGETQRPGAYFYHWLVTWPGNAGPESFPNDTRGLVLSIVATNPFLAGQVLAQGAASSP